MDNNSLLGLSEQDLNRIRKEVMETVGLGLFRYMMDGTVVYADQTALKIADLTEKFKDPSEVLGKKIDELFVYLSEKGRLRAELKEKGKVDRFDYRFKTLTGKIKWIRHVSFLTHDKESGQECVQSAIFDITVLKNAQNALGESERRIKSLLEAADDIIFSFDKDGVFLFCNSVALRQLGFESADELLGKTIWDVFSKADASRMSESIGKVFETGQVQRYELTPTVIAGEQRWHSTTLSPVADDKGQVLRVLGISRDVTDFVKAEAERRKLEEQVQQSQKMESLGMLAVGIAHDFNNLLVAVLGNADLALMDLPPESSARLAIEQIRNAAVKASELTNQMLAYSGRGKALVRKLDVNKMIDDMIQLVKVSISKHIKLEMDLLKDLPLVQGDSAQLQQVLMNLVTNAAEAIGEKKGRISLSTSLMMVDEDLAQKLCVKEGVSSGKYVCIQVKDNGVGMDTDTMDRIFEPFFSTKFTGRGLGLSAVIGIVRSHRGSMLIDSFPGEGSTFSILLPALGSEYSRPLASNDSKTLLNGSGTVLVVDDEASVRQVARDMLNHFGFKVIVAASGLEGLDILKKRGDEIRLVLLDLSMPEMGGEETLRKMYELRPELPVLLCSGYSEEDAISQFSDAVPAGFLQKPFDVSRLLEKLKEVLD